MRLVLLLCLFLVGCGGSSPTPPPAQPLLPIPTVGWAITESSLVPLGQMISLATPSFAFPQCASAQTCHIAYVELAYTSPLAGSALKLDYEVVGSNPTFVADSAGNTCTPLIPALGLLIHRGPDTGLAPTEDQNRWFSGQKYQQALALGQHTMIVQLLQSEWGAVLNDGTAAGWSTAIANPGSIGFTLGGGCFAGHGVAVNSGSAALNIKGYQVLP